MTRHNSDPSDGRQTMSPPVVLCFSAADPTAGAGMQADVLTLACLGCHPASVITAITVQDTVGVEGVLPIEDGWIVDQARALLEDMPVAAFKLGMLGSIEAVTGIAEILSDYPDVPVIFDPVLASGRGDQFADEDIVEAMVGLLLPQTTILTPNTLELRRLAQVIADGSVAQDSSQAAAARLLIDAGCEYVLVTGTHENTEHVVNTLYGRHGRVRADSWDRLPGSYHGSGCTLASALAANIALGQAVEEAVLLAQEYTWHSLVAGFRPGMGQFIPDRLFWADVVDDADGKDGPEVVPQSSGAST